MKKAFFGLLILLFSSCEDAYFQLLFHMQTIRKAFWGFIFGFKLLETSILGADYVHEHFVKRRIPSEREYKRIIQGLE